MLNIDGVATKSNSTFSGNDQFNSVYVIGLLFSLSLSYSRPCYGDSLSNEILTEHIIAGIYTNAKSFTKSDTQHYSILKLMYMSKSSIARSVDQGASSRL